MGLLLAPMTLVATRVMKAPYGRFGPRSGGWAVNSRLGWFLMELPATLCFWPFYLSGPFAGQLVPSILATVWAIHYINRGFIFPVLIRVPRQGGANFGALVLVTGMLVTALHGYLHGKFFSTFGTHLTTAWLGDPRFIMGLVAYGLGFMLNVHSDAILRNLRTPGEIARGQKVYRIPRGGGFELVTNPSYLGELSMWLGFTLAAWSLPGLFILSLSIANLLPRAIDNHRWYRRQFPDYPAHRRILIPYVF